MMRGSLRRRAARSARASAMISLEACCAMCCWPLLTGNIPRHKGAHGPKAAPPQKKINKEYRHVFLMWVHLRHLVCYKHLSVMERSMHMHKERNELTPAVGNGTHAQSIASLHLFCYTLRVDDWK